MKIGKASNMFDASPYSTVLIYGGSGMGKTTWAADAPMPLFVLLEHQATKSIRISNPDAQIIEVDTPAELGKVMALVLTSRRVTLESGQSAATLTISGQELTYQTLVIDSLTEYCEWLVQQAESPVKAKSGGPPVHQGTRVEANTMQVTIQRYGDIRSATKRFCSDAGRIPANVIFIARARLEEETATIVPMTAPKGLGREVIGYFTACGYAEAGKQGLVVRWAQTPGRLCKPGSPHWPKAVPNNFGPGQRVTLGSLALYDGQAMDSDCRTIPANNGDSAELVASIKQQLKAAPAVTGDDSDEF